MNRFLGRCLNLGLMNPLQGSLFIFFIKGCKSLGSVLEHVTRSRAVGELDCTCLPIYHQVVLCQPCVA